MSGINSEKWLLVEWGNGAHGVLKSEYMLDTKPVYMTGDSVTISIDGEQQLATYLARSDDRELLEQFRGDNPGPSIPPEPEVKDFPSSASSWQPSDDEDQVDSDYEVHHKKRKTDTVIERYTKRRNKRVMKPCNKVDAIVPQKMRRSNQRPDQRNARSSRTRKSQKTVNEIKDRIDENKNDQLPKQVNITVDTKLIFDLFATIGSISQLLDDNVSESHNNTTNPLDNRYTDSTPMQYDNKPGPSRYSCNGEVAESNIFQDDANTSRHGNRKVSKKHSEPALYCSTEDLEETNIQDNANQIVNKIDTEYEFAEPDPHVSNRHHDTVVPDYDMEDERRNSDESHRSDDNVLISNKYENVDNSWCQDKNEEWIPIGSGKTLIHIDKFRKVKWSTYPIATRTLLLALFPRRILATHSLTGKKSPAFRDKPAKMCLDPKKISDVIIEVMTRFKVKENLVRSIITTKCADESKMFRTRMEKKKTNKPKKIKEVKDEVNDEEAKDSESTKEEEDDQAEGESSKDTEPDKSDESNKENVN